MNHEGIGLGLTIVKKIVEASGGEVFVHSDGIGKGSVFSFTMQMESEDKEFEPCQQDVSPEERK